MAVTRENVWSRYSDILEAYNEEERRLRDQILTESPCDHANTDITYVQNRNSAGSWCFYRQCVCGQHWQTSRAIVVDRGLDPAELPQLVVVEHQSDWQERRAIYDQELFVIRERYTERAWQRYTEECNVLHVEYEDYLRSPQWRRIRELVLKRDSYICQGCLINRAIQVHHMTYEHLGDEFMWELISICGTCHARYHGKDIPPGPPPALA